MLVTYNAFAAQSAVVAHDMQYYKKNVGNTELIYTKDAQDTAQNVANLEMLLQPAYEKTFGYRLDEQLETALASGYNQIANGFTDFLPVARQVDYIGGALYPDYFCTTSWIDTLIYHESAHSYQINAKDNIVSSSLHTVLKNGSFFVPWFTNPNIVENSFLLEGNAVLNESWHGNGGRLYGGNFYAETLLQAKYKRLKPALLYNDNLNFLYGSHYYTLGSFYQYFLAKKYGLKRVNSYFKIHSQEWAWPFFTNAQTEKTFGKDFETLIAEWSESLQKDAAALHEAKGKELASSQFFTPLNADKNAIYFMINESGRGYPKRVLFDKKYQRLSVRETSHKMGKVIKTITEMYATQAWGKMNPWRIYIGLYDANGLRLAGTDSKVVEGYMRDGRMVYFDINSSWSNPQLYVGKKFYASVNSSVFIKENDLYYTKQQGKRKTFYKNKRALFSIRSFYGHVVGADDKGVYFIANTRFGSGLFAYRAGKFYRLSDADTIIDAQMINSKSAVVASVGVDAYKYLQIPLRAKEEAPFKVKLFMEDKAYYKTASEDAAQEMENAPKVALKHPYHALLDMRYSGTDIDFGSDSSAGYIYDISMNFADPLMQNQFGLFLSKNLDDITLAGVRYANEQYFIALYLCQKVCIHTHTKMFCIA
jgi:hypothetical protein